jgi:hypothetical protein
MQSVVCLFCLLLCNFLLIEDAVDAEYRKIVLRLVTFTQFVMILFLDISFYCLMHASPQDLWHKKFLY